MSRSKHGRRRALWKVSNPCDCWLCMPVAEKKEKLLRRTEALDFAQQVSDHSPEEIRAMARLEAWEDAQVVNGELQNWAEQLTQEMMSK